jgi:hypothetical protein
MKMVIKPVSNVISKYIFLHFVVSKNFLWFVAIYDELLSSQWTDHRRFPDMDNLYLYLDYGNAASLICYLLERIFFPPDTFDDGLPAVSPSIIYLLCYSCVTLLGLQLYVV